MNDASGTFVVVGAGPGVGLASARRFGATGMPVGLIARSPSILDELEQQLAADGVVSATAVADVTDDEALIAAVCALRERLGPIDTVLFSPRPDTAWIKPVLDTTPDDLMAALHLNVAAAAATVRAVVPEMRRRRRGTLLFTTGGAAVEPSAERAVSAVAYAAESTYVRLLHDTLAGDGVHVGQVTVVGAIGPGLTHEPAAVAEELWNRWRRRDEPLIVLR